jgi:hypothetical protein
VPTISLLFDIPIPYSSLGSLIPELFHGNSREMVDEETVSNNDIGKFTTKMILDENNLIERKLFCMNAIFAITYKTMRTII